MNLHEPSLNVCIRSPTIKDHRSTKDLKAMSEDRIIMNGFKWQESETATRYTLSTHELSFVSTAATEIGAVENESS
jgi:hypothetical protein